MNRLLRDCLDLPSNRRRRDLPVILLLGTRGSGKTELLRTIYQQCSGVRPCVLLEDLNAHDRLRPHKVAARLAYGLSKRVKQFGRLQFPRLALGLVAIRSNVDQEDREKARAVLKHLFLGNRRALITKLRAISHGLLEELGAPPGSKGLVGIALEGTMAVWAVMLLRGRAFTWYRHGLGLPFEDPLDALIELWLWEARGTPEARAEVDQVLCRAFLADLRDAFTKGWKAKARTGNCVALIDNADSPAGDAFLEVLAHERHRHAENTSEDCDPLVVVAAGCTQFPEFALRDGRKGSRGN